MQFCRIGLQIETISTGAVVLRQGFSTKICRLRRRKCAFVIFETHPKAPSFDWIAHRQAKAPCGRNGQTLLHRRLFSLKNPEIP
jgi:hypothetical protein